MTLDAEHAYLRLRYQRGMMKNTMQSDFEEIELKKDGEWSPKVVFRILSLADVLSVEMKLESSNDSW